MTPDRHQQAIAAVLCLLAALALLLASRRPAWRPFAHQLAALATLDLARLWTSPLAQTRAQPWWGLDVALVALWPVVLAWGLLDRRVVRDVDQVRLSKQAVADRVDRGPREAGWGRLAIAEIPDGGGDEAEDD